jgi:ketosteroid isomerase-like protein
MLPCSAVFGKSEQESGSAGSIRDPRMTVVKTIVTSAVFLSVVCLLTSLTAPETCAAAASENTPQKQDEQALIEIEHQWAAAYVSGDADKLSSIFSSDYIQTNTRGVVTGKTEEVDDLRAGGLHYEKFDTTEMKVQLYGDAAVVTGRIYLKGVDKKSGKTIEGSMRMTDTFIRQGGKWQVVASQTTALPAS